MVKLKYKIPLHIIILLITLIWLSAITVLPAIPVKPVLADDRPAISLNPREGPVGTKVYVTLTDFEPGTIDISFDAESNVVETDSTDDNGNLYTYFIISEYPAGKYKVWATDSEDDQEITYFTIEPEIELDSSSGRVGDDIIIDGTGFAANSEVSICFDGDELTIDKTNEDGCFNGATFKVPESYNGNHTIKATDESSNHADTSFSTKQSITVSNTSGAIGTGVTISGTGFSANNDITVQLANEKVAISKSDDKGSFSDSFIVPAMVKGTYRIKVSDQDGNNDYADFSTLAATTINPTTGHVGTEVTANGAGLTPNTNIVVKYDNAQVAKATSDATGSFEVTFNIPVSQHGEHTITITDTTNTVETIFTMESTPPSAPRLLLPASGTKVSETPQFTWERVTDPSGVTYTLQVATDSNFSNVVLSSSGLTDLEYVVTEGEKLPPKKKESPYYWRVKAVDKAANTSEWSAAGSFYMGITLAAPPGWVQWGLTGLGITLFGFLFGTFLNKLRGIAIGD